MNSNDTTEEQISLAYSRKKYNDKHEDVFKIEKTNRGYWIVKKSSRMFIPFEDVGIFKLVGLEVKLDYLKFGKSQPRYSGCLNRETETQTPRIKWCFKYIRERIINVGYRPQ